MAVIAVVVRTVGAPMVAATVVCGPPGVVVEDDAQRGGVVGVVFANGPAFAIAIAGHVGGRHGSTRGEDAAGHGNYECALAEH